MCPVYRHNHSWNILFQGQKLWIAYPPHLIPAGLPSCVAGTIIDASVHSTCVSFFLRASSVSRSFGIGIEDPLQRETMESAMRWAHTELDQLIWKSFVQQDRIRLVSGFHVARRTAYSSCCVHCLRCVFSLAWYVVAGTGDTVESPELNSCTLFERRTQAMIERLLGGCFATRIWC